MKYLVLLSLSALATACAAPVTPGGGARMANPASQHCVDVGGKLRIDNTPAGQVGICQLPDGTEVEEWELFRQHEASGARSGAQTAADAGADTVEYSCRGQQNIKVTYYANEGKAVLHRHGSSIELQQQRTGSGFAYSNGPNTIRGKGKELRLEIGRMVPIICQAVG